MRGVEGGLGMAKGVEDEMEGCKDMAFLNCIEHEILVGSQQIIALNLKENDLKNSSHDGFERNLLY
jgi:hypothetical protein